MFVTSLEFTVVFSSIFLFQYQVKVVVQNAKTSYKQEQQMHHNEATEGYAAAVTG